VPLTHAVALPLRDRRGRPPVHTELSVSSNAGFGCQRDGAGKSHRKCFFSLARVARVKCPIAQRGSTKAAQ